MFQKLQIIFLVLIFVNYSQSCPLKNFSKLKYNSEDPSSWGGTCASGTSQSPIHLPAINLVAISASTTLNITGAYSQDPVSVKATNNGHGVTFTFAYDEGAVPSITGGPLGNDLYNFAQFHFHWPCEHTCDSISPCALEIHFVHYNSKYGSVDNAVNQADGLAVFGLMYEEDSSAPSLPFMSYIEHVLSYGTSYTASGDADDDDDEIFRPIDVIDLESMPPIYSYKGSLTTPPCGELKTFIIIMKFFSKFFNFF